MQLSGGVDLKDIMICQNGEALILMTVVHSLIKDPLY